MSLPMPRPVSDAIAHVAKDAVGKDWAALAALFRHWPEIVGAEYAATVAPVKLVFPKGKKSGEKWAEGARGGGVLTVRLPQGLAMEFAFRGETVKTRINGFLGYEAVSRLAYDTYYPKRAAKVPAPPPVPADARTISDVRRATESVEDEELRAVLQSLGEAILRKGR